MVENILKPQITMQGTEILPDDPLRLHREIAQKDLEIQGLLERIRELETRQESELQKQLLYSLFMPAPTPIAVLRGADQVVELANPAICEVWGRAEHEVLNRPLIEVIPGLRDQIYPALLDRVYRTGVPYIGREVASTLARTSMGWPMYFNF